MHEPFCCPSRCGLACSFLLIDRGLLPSLFTFPACFTHLLSSPLPIGLKAFYFYFLVHEKIVIISSKLHLNLTCSLLPFLLHPGLYKGTWSQSDHRYTESSSLFIKNTVWFINSWCELSFKKLTPLQYDFLMHCFHKTK